MRLPSFKRLNKGDYPPEDQSFIEKISISLNTGIESLYEALNNKLTFRDNFASTIGEFLVTVDSDGFPLNSTSFKLNNTSRIEGILVIAVENTRNPDIPPPGYPWVSYSVSSNIMRITNVKGLSANTPYRIKVIVLN